MSINNNPFNAKILANMNTNYSTLIKSGATGIGNDAMSKSIFSKLDIDQNGTLSQMEIDNAMPSLQDIFKEAVTSFKDIASYLFGGEKTENDTPETVPDNTNKPENQPNGKIDKDFKQGATGDCWLLAGIAAKASTPEGLEDLNKMLSVDDKGNVTVEIEGKQYKFSKEALESNKELSTGDLDVRALEAAVRSIRNESQNNTPSSWTGDKNVLNGGTINEMFHFLSFGKEGGGNTEWHSMDKDSDLAIDILKHNNTPDALGKKAMVAGTGNNDISNLKAFDENNNPVELVNHHAYAAIKADEEYVYLKNPHDTSQTLKMSHEDFKSAFTDFATQDSSTLSNYIYEGNEIDFIPEIQLDEIIPEKPKIPKEE